VTAAVPTRSSRNGKPLAAIAGEAFAEPGFGMVVSIALASIDIGDNVRVNIEAIDELATSIAEHGVLQPIKVRPHGERFEVVWGQRRVLASRKAGLERIPALITTTDQAIADRSIEQLIENLHRADLNPIDRAQAMKSVVASGVSQADLARSLGLAPSTVANDLGLLDAPPKIQDLVERGELTPSHAKAMKGLAPSSQAELATRIVKDGLSAHDTERAVQALKDNEAWRKKREAEEAAAAQQNADRFNAQLADLTKKKVPADARIIVAGQYGAGGLEPVAEFVRAAGFTNVTTGTIAGWQNDNGIRRRSATLGCDCGVWLVEKDWNGIYVLPGCINVKHAKAKDEAGEKKRRDKHALETKVQEALSRTGPGLAAVWPGDTGAILVQPLAVQMALWQALDYGAAEWSVAHGGTRSNPWATIRTLSPEELAHELGEQLAKGFRDHYGYHVDWDGLAEELGVTVPAE
jgi:ParB family chromosome partitioning protein